MFDCLTPKTNKCLTNIKKN